MPVGPLVFFALESKGIPKAPAILVLESLEIPRASISTFLGRDPLDLYLPILESLGMPIILNRFRSGTNHL